MGALARSSECDLHVVFNGFTKFDAAGDALLCDADVAYHNNVSRHAP
jgi:hypothetical protein